MKREICRKVVDMGAYGRHTVVYAVLSKFSDEFQKELYGLSVEIPESGEEEEIGYITSLKSVAVGIVKALADGGVTPISARDVVQDLISEI